MQELFRDSVVVEVCNTPACASFYNPANFNDLSFNLPLNWWRANQTSSYLQNPLEEVPPEESTKAQLETVPLDSMSIYLWINTICFTLS